jgi:hypothetical protein
MGQQPLIERMDALMNRIRTAEGHSDEEVEAILGEGYSRVVAIERERLLLQREIDVLTEHIEEPESAQRMRHLWLRLRGYERELDELRQRLATLRERISP